MQLHSIHHRICGDPFFQLNTEVYLKLHGSINWATCSSEGCKNQIIPIGLRGFHPETSSDAEAVFFNLGSKISSYTHTACKKPLVGPPVLVPPTWNKTGYHQDLVYVWGRAAQEIAEAENIFVIGYSLPETDSFFRYLYALASESKTRIKRFWVFNPDPDGTVEPQFKALIGRGIENRFKFINGEAGKFENAIPLIRDELRKA